MKQDKTRKEVKKNKREDTVSSITAHIDLLGFSSHLILGNYDIRTKIGAEALKRLKIIEEAINLFEGERKEFPEIYPQKKYIRYFRFNDSLFMGMDLREDIIPVIGTVNITGGVSLKIYHKIAKKELNEEKRTKKFYDFYAKEGFEVAKFVGLVARIHNFINKKEKENNFPGCRTVIASGLRKKFVDRNGNDDFLSVNFSLSNAYLTNKKGEKEGISGDNLYLDDNIARVIRYDEHCKSILSYSKYISKSEFTDPYEDYMTIYQDYFSLAKREKVILFRKEFFFKQVNPNIFELFQLLPHLKKYLNGKKAPNDFIESLINCIKKPAPPLEEIQRKENRLKFYPLLSLIFNLDENLKETLSVFDKE